MVSHNPEETFLRTRRRPCIIVVDERGFHTAHPVDVDAMTLAEILRGDKSTTLGVQVRRFKDPTVVVYYNSRSKEPFCINIAGTPLRGKLIICGRLLDENVGLTEDQVSNIRKELDLPNFRSSVASMPLLPSNDSDPFH